MNPVSLLPHLVCNYAMGRTVDSTAEWFTRLFCVHTKDNRWTAVPSKFCLG